MTDEQFQKFIKDAANSMIEETAKQSKPINTDEFKNGTINFYLPFVQDK